jgi:hypothetical protein
MTGALNSLDSRALNTDDDDDNNNNNYYYYNTFLL